MTDTWTIATAGEIIVDFVSHRIGCGLTQVSDYSGPYPAGAPPIFINQAARMGSPTEIIGGVGQDGFGRAVLGRLQKDGVGTSGVTQHADCSTGVAFVSYYGDGTRDFIFHFDDTVVDHFTVPQGLLPLDKTYFHVSAASLGNEKMRGHIMGLMRDVAAAGGRVTCDPNARPELMRDTAVRDALAEAMDAAYCLMPSTSDLDFLYPDLTEDAAVDKMLSASAEVIVVKRGGAGATVLGHGERHDFAPHIVEEVDPTGAGDCFGGTFVALMAQGAPLKDAGEAANAAGAMAVTKRGGMEGNCSPAEINAFIARSRG